jgi:glycosyltransferase involved in cell wall biosynthesis
MISYVIVTPVRDEAEYIEKTIWSIVNQKILPDEWLIIDDNSKDETCKIVSEYAEQYSFIRLLKMPFDTVRTPGSGVMRAFNYGCTQLSVRNYDYIVKLDADLSFAPDFFEGIFGEFAKNERLGIASGLILEADTLQPVKSNYPEHTYGNTKMYKRACFEKISPIEQIKNWDFLDNIKAKSEGFETRIITTQEVVHLKPLDSVVGKKKENYLKGYYDAYLGYLGVFVLLKFFRLLLERPFVSSGYMYARGYLKNILVDKKYYDNERVIRLIRQQQADRIKSLARFSGLL